jgi:hypothetical protein
MNSPEQEKDMGVGLVTDIDELLGDTKKEVDIEGPGDFFFALIIILMSLGTFFMILSMPREKGWLTSPGIFPLLTVIILFGLGIGLLFMTVRGKDIKASVLFGLNKITQDADPRMVKRTVVAVLGILIYTVVLIPTVHFTIGSFIYLVGTLWYFWKGKVYKILIISAVTTLFLSEVFKRFFNIMLP